MCTGFHRLSQLQLSSSGKGGGAGGIYALSRPVQCDYFKASRHHLLSRLQQELRDIEERTASEAVVQGRHNAYVRTARYPPCHININYLLDPAMLFPNALDRLYDEQHSNIALSRADSMIFPGIARVPFDPTAIPKGKDDPDRSSWYHRLQDIFFG